MYLLNKSCFFISRVCVSPMKRNIQDPNDETPLKPKEWELVIQYADRLAGRNCMRDYA